MAKRQFELTKREIADLRQAEQQTRDVHQLRRLQAVRLYGSGVPTNQIVEGGLWKVQPPAMGDGLPPAWT
jgi:hypothetical protein